MPSSGGSPLHTYSDVILLKNVVNGGKNIRLRHTRAISRGNSLLPVIYLAVYTASCQK